MVILFNFPPPSSHLHPQQVENCDSNSRLVVDEDDNGKFRLERVKPICSNVTEPLTHVMNLSLAKGIVSLEHKIAKVTKLFKNDNKMYVNNYTPVSVLPLLSKLPELLMYNRISTFISKHDILYRYQYSFGQHYSTNLNCITLVLQITESLEKGECV